MNKKKLARLLTARHFERTIAPFVGAIHSEIIDLRHASVILLHFEKFGALFDEWAHILVEDLRVEGITGNQGDAVARIIFESFRDVSYVCLACYSEYTDTLLVRVQASDLYLSSNRTEADMMGLARLLCSAVVVRGPQLSIKQRLPADDHVRIHTDIAEFLLGKIARYEKGDRKEERTKALILFKALALLLIGVEGKGALKM